MPNILVERRPNNLFFASLVPEDAEVLFLLDFVERLHKAKDVHTRVALDQILSHCEVKCQNVWGPKRDKFHYLDEQMVHTCYLDKCVSARLLDICLMAGDLPDVLKVLKPHTDILQEQKYDYHGPSHKVPWCIEVRTSAFAKSLASAVHAHGWEACGGFLLLMFQRHHSIVENCVHYGELALELRLLGLHEEAFTVAAEVLKPVSASMP